MIKLYHNLFKLHDGILPNLKAGSYIESRFFLSFINHYLTNALCIYWQSFKTPFESEAGIEIS